MALIRSQAFTVGRKPCTNNLVFRGREKDVPILGVSWPASGLPGFQQFGAIGFGHTLSESTIAPERHRLESDVRDFWVNLHVLAIELVSFCSIENSERTREEKTILKSGFEAHGEPNLSPRVYLRKPLLRKAQAPISTN